VAIPHADLINRLHELDQALAHHGRWYAQLNRQLICQQTARADDLAADAHERCAFGKWFNSEGKRHFGKEPCFGAISVAHEAVHGIARHLLELRRDGKDIAPDDYDALVAVALRFRQLLRRLELELTERLGGVDKLTGVWNRQAVNLRLAEETERVQRTRQPCSLCFVDLDDFGALNERLGQKGGDNLIQSVVAFFKTRLRGYDTLFRMGGEEFLICLPSTALDDAGPLINRLREELAEQDFGPAGQSVRVTASFGLIELEPIFFIEETLERVERAQIVARKQGGNQVCIWREDWQVDSGPDAEAG
jgi:diguanylate cyclase (GGDEF)-like protein